MKPREVLRKMGINIPEEHADNPEYVLFAADSQGLTSRRGLYKWAEEEIVKYAPWIIRIQKLFL